MTAQEVRTLVEREIAGNWERTNAHRCDLRQCLVTPVVHRFESFGCGDPDGFVQLWIVLEEFPERCDGYKIVYDEELGAFGLACPGVAGQAAYLGQYGTFLETFEAM